METKTLKLTDIRTDGGTQSRVVIDIPTVKRYAEAMTEGEKFPPIEVYFDGRSNFLVDGFHRLAAAKLNGNETIEAEVKPGTQREAVLYSKGVNRRHGLQTTIADKRKVVTEMLQDSEWVQWSDSQIARTCGVSQPFVSGIRAKLAPKASNVISSKPRNYKTASGKTAQMNTGNIGKSQPITRVNEPDTYVSEFPEKQVDEIVTRNGHLSPNAPVGTVIRNGKAEPSAPLIPMVNAPHLNPAANGKPYTNGTGAHPVDSTKLQAEVDRLRAENERLTAENTKLKAAAALTVQPLLMTRAAAYGITPALTSKYTAKYGEDTLRLTINYLIDLNLKADDRDLLKKVLETVKPSGAIKYPNDVKKWKPDHTAAYYKEFDTVLDALRTAWGQDCKLSHWEDLTLSEQKDFISIQQELSGKLDCSEYPALVKYVKVWKDAPLSMLAKKVTEWRQSLNVPSADDDFKKLWGGEEEFIPTAENTDPQQAAEVREVMNGLLSILDNNMKELEPAHAG